MSEYMEANPKPETHEFEGDPGEYMQKMQEQAKLAKEGGSAPEEESEPAWDEDDLPEEPEDEE